MGLQKLFFESIKNKYRKKNITPSLFTLVHNDKSKLSQMELRRNADTVYRLVKPKLISEGEKLRQSTAKLIRASTDKQTLWWKRSTADYAKREQILTKKLAADRELIFKYSKKTEEAAKNALTATETLTKRDVENIVEERLSVAATQILSEFKILNRENERGRITRDECDKMYDALRKGTVSIKW